MHTLVIESLHDLKAHCSCGGWSIVSTTHDDEPDEVIRAKALSWFGRHTDYAKDRATNN